MFTPTWYHDETFPVVLDGFGVKMRSNYTSTVSFGLMFRQPNNLMLDSKILPLEITPSGKEANDIQP